MKCGIGTLKNRLVHREIVILVSNHQEKIKTPVNQKRSILSVESLFI